jgi:predicted PurR-regulated permease PerM
MPKTHPHDRTPPPGPNQPAAPGDWKPFLERLLLTVLVVTAAVLTLLFVWYAVDVLLLVFAGVLLAVFLHGLSSWLSDRTPLGERGAMAVVGGGLLALVGISGYFFAPAISEQFTALTDQLPRAATRVLERIEQSSLGAWVLNSVPDLNSSEAGNRDLISQAMSVFSSILAGLANTLIIVFIGIYLAVRPRLYIEGFLRLIPIPRRERIREVIQVVGYTLKRWLLGRALLMIEIGIITTIGLSLLDIPFALALGIIAALLSFIPNIGPLLSVVPAVLLALIEGPTKALYVLALYAGIQTIDTYIFEPLVEQRAVSLPPVMVITAQILMGISLGVLGLLLATPLVATIVVVIKMVYVEDTLGDRSITVKGEHKLTHVAKPDAESPAPAPD